MRRRSKKGKKALVLNADYTAMKVESARQALKAVVKNSFDPQCGLQPVDYYDIKILSCGGRYFPLPSVVRSPIYIKPRGNRIPFSRKNLYIRDNYTCMYCGKQDYTARLLTKDHVIPRAIWRNQNHKQTPTGWTNIVTACRKCNLKKANRTPKQAGMFPKIEPFEPKPHNHILGFSPWMTIEPSWRPYLPKNLRILLDKLENRV